MSFPEIVILLLLVPPLLAKLARLMEARESPPPKNDASPAEPFPHILEGPPRRRHRRKRRGRSPRTNGVRTGRN
jgi:hypothetical protein